MALTTLNLVQILNGPSDKLCGTRRGLNILTVAGFVSNDMMNALSKDLFLWYA